jgi:hypothetical protein
MPASVSVFSSKTTKTEPQSSSSTTKQRSYICYMCSKIFDSIETLDSHKKLEHGELGQSKPPAGVS